MSVLDSDAKTWCTIIGDAFVDIVCIVDNHENDKVLRPGGDTLLKSPVQVLAGGSGLNTSTHLHFLSRHVNKIAHDQGDHQEVNQQTYLL